jgi:orotidine-5'-phosphate decarboxylase
MNRGQLVEIIRQKKSCLCVGLDTDPGRIPECLSSDPDPVYEFNKRIIDATQEYCVAYKINTAFYEVSGGKGWESMAKTVAYIPATHFTIADAKRGDIGNTSSLYARAFFETLNVDAITVAPYMGEDSVRPLLDYKGKWTILLGLTSNPGARDFELQISEGEYWYERVIKTATAWGTPENLMFVVGATQAKSLERIRTLAPDYFYLVPGVGTQGGSLKDILGKGMNQDVGLLVNVSRAVIYASAVDNFAEAAALMASKYQIEMQHFL